MSVRVMLADDEAPARRKLARFLSARSDVEIVAEASNGVDAVDLVAMTAPDLLFLDIHMPELDGLGVAEALAHGERPPRIVFVTAHDRYAVQAFEVSALDYLLKPYDRARFDRAFERARAALACAAEPSGRIAEALARARRDDAYLRRLLIPNHGRSFFVPIQDVVSFESRDGAVIAHLRGGSHAIRGTLEALEARLDPEQFVRVHRSHVANIDEVDEVAPWFHGDFKLRLKNGTELKWSRRYAVRRPDILK